MAEHLIEFTQYLRPNGRQKKVHFESTEEKALLAEKLIKQGAKFEIEVLQNGEIVMYAYDTNIYDHDIDAYKMIDMRICDNGPEVVENINDMLDMTESYYS